MNGVIESSVREIKNYPEDLFDRKKNKEFLNQAKKLLKTVDTSISPYYSSNIFYNMLKKEYDMYYFNGDKVVEKNKNHLVDGFETFFSLKKTPSNFIKTLSMSVLASKKN